MRGEGAHIGQSLVSDLICSFPNPEKGVNKTGESSPGDGGKEKVGEHVVPGPTVSNSLT